MAVAAVRGALTGHGLCQAVADIMETLDIEDGAEYEDLLSNAPTELADMLEPEDEE